MVSSAVNNKIKIPSGAEELVGKAVEHLFEKEDGEKNEWRGMVLSRAPIMTNWYYITYEKDPVLYMYQLWDDYADGDLRILPEAGACGLQRQADMSDLVFASYFKAFIAKPLITSKFAVMAGVVVVCTSHIIAQGFNSSRLKTRETIWSVLIIGHLNNASFPNIRL